MGVQGLWEILEPAGQSHSLTKIAVVDGFENNESGRRAYRIGIDASIWYQHAEHSTKEGANPELRLLFFRLAKLAKLPWLCLFVFDGRERPKVKRGSRMGKSGSHGLTQKFKEMIESFGMEWRMARGEAEAELAYLNSQGIIDAILTDDVDALVFGARTIIRNSSLALTGNKKNPATDASGKKCDQHAMIFVADRIATHSNIGLSRGGMILFALLSGGDYDKGVKNLGSKFAHGLARCGFGDRLLAAYRQGDAHFRLFLPQWRNELNTEICNNTSGLLPARRPSATLPLSWPDANLIDTYVSPVCSAMDGSSIAGLALRDRGDMSLLRLAKFCEDHFDEWGHRSRILERFHNFMYEGAVFHVLRRAALEADDKEKARRIREGQSANLREPLRPAAVDGVGTPAPLVRRCLDPAKTDLREERLASAFVRRNIPPASPSVDNALDTHPLIESIVGTRQHLETDRILEFRVVIRCKQLDDLTNKGITGKHPEPASVSDNLLDLDGVYSASNRTPKKAKKPIDRQTKRIWVAASIMRHVHPNLVQLFEAEGVTKTRRKRKAPAPNEVEDSEGDIDGPLATAEHPNSPVRSQLSTRHDRRSGPPTCMIDSRPAVVRPLEITRRPRLMHNVGDINFERSTNPNAFHFTFTDPCEPNMLLIEDEPLDEASEFVVGSSTRPSGGSDPIPVRSILHDATTSASAPVSVYDEPPPPASQFTAAQEAMMNRALGLPVGGSSGRAKHKKTTATTKKRNAGHNATHLTPQADVTNQLPPSQYTPAQEAMMNSALALGSSSFSMHARASTTRAAPSSSRPQYEEPVPSQFTTRQEAMIDRALGLGSSSANTRTTTATARTRPPARAPRQARPPTVQSTAQQQLKSPNAVNSDAGGSFANSTAGAVGPQALPSSTVRAWNSENRPSQFTTRQDPMIDRALGFGSSTGNIRARPSATSTQRRPSALPLTDQTRVEPTTASHVPPALPAFSDVHEQMINRALGIGQKSTKRARGPTVAEMATYREEAQAERAKRRKTRVVVDPTPTPATGGPKHNTLAASSIAPRQPLATFPDLPPLRDVSFGSASSSSLPHKRPPLRPAPTEDDVIDISDDEPSTSASSTKGHRDSRATNAWLAPSSSQDSRLVDELECDFDLT